MRARSTCSEGFEGQIGGHQGSVQLPLSFATVIEQKLEGVCLIRYYMQITLFS